LKLRSNKRKYRHDSPELPWLLWVQETTGVRKNEKAEYSFFPNSYGGNDPHEGTCKTGSGDSIESGKECKEKPGGDQAADPAQHSFTSSKTAKTLSLCRNKLS